MRPSIKFAISETQAKLEEVSDRDPELGTALYSLLVKTLLIQDPKKALEVFDLLIQLIDALSAT